MNKLPYSYHTFYFPFVWDRDSLNYEGMVELFEENPYWENSDYQSRSEMKSEQWYRSVSNVSDELRFDYQCFQYFNIPARNAIYGCKEGIVRNFSFRPNGRMIKMQNAEYIIMKGDKSYKLTLNAINLKIYNTGIAIMIYECENHDYRKITDVKNINEYGRRIAAPFLPNSSDSFRLFADRLSIMVSGIEIAADDFIVHFQQILTQPALDDRAKAASKAEYSYTDFKNEKQGKSEHKYIQLTNVPRIIEHILDYGAGDNEHFTSCYETACQDKTKIHIYPALDDRMFVACAVLDAAYAEKLKGETYWNRMDTEDVYAYQTDYETACSLYELAFIDTAGNVSSPCPVMLKNLLNTHVYSRWGAWGTFYAVTHHSMICVTSPKVLEPVVYPFLGEYCQIAALCLAQRASIVSFQAESNVLAPKMNDQEITTLEKTRQFMKLQREYISFINQLCFFEVTSQEQGVEMYELLRSALYIDKEKDVLENQIEKMKDVTNSALDHDLNHYGFWFAVIAMIMAVTGPLTDKVSFFGDMDTNSFIGKPFYTLELICETVLIVILTMHAFGIIKLKFLKRKKGK